MSLSDRTDPKPLSLPLRGGPAPRRQWLHDLLKAAGLRFDDPAEERRFVDSYVRSQIGWTQAAMVLGALTYAGYTFWDWMLYPEVVPITLAIRGGTALLVLLPLTLLLGIARRWAETILLLYCVIPGCVLPSVYLVLPSGFTYASAGMIIVILFVSTMLPLRIGSLLIFCVTTWLAFAFAERLAPEMSPGLGFINHFLIGNSYLLSLYAVGAREHRARRQFATTEALQRETARSEASLRELRATQAHLVQAEKLAALGQLVAGVGHEVSTPIGLALTTSSAMQADVRDLARALEGAAVRRSDLTRGIGRLDQGLRMTQQNLLRASEMIHAFKQVAVDQANEQREGFELRGWLSTSFDKLRPLLSRRGLTVELNVPEGITLISRPGALGQVLGILAFNAAIHAYPGDAEGVLHVEAARIAPDRVRITLADDGVGIPADRAERIFDPFFTTKRDGGSIGLGLHIAFNLVASTLGGTIELIGSEHGAAFQIDLPTMSPS
ncbi:sensor histidine kinase [Rhodopseudomonas sp. WA056]|uniref:sensor histidine kinase n=1 Tax=Rhodopseudomonas sp. WA056 TaxID=2269367 RepID=UPI0013DFF058|nr:ATP-binding protein [Rhodopseudomonas sp. WA056]NEW86168.1 sensor histidine kinase [Rhodopseudomonas sp. WA056]